MDFILLLQHQRQATNIKRSPYYYCIKATAAAAVLQIEYLFNFNCFYEIYTNIFVFVNFIVFFVQKTKNTS